MNRESAEPLLRQQVATYLGAGEIDRSLQAFIESVGKTYTEYEQELAGLQRQVEALTKAKECTPIDGQCTLEAEWHEQRALIEKLKSTQHQLLQAEKMASIGQLAAGVAHEINNPVGFVHANLGVLREYVQSMLQVIAAYEARMPDDPDMRELYRRVDFEYLRDDIASIISETEEGVQRVRGIVQDLKDFSHVDQGEWGWADLHRGLDSTLNIVNNEIKYRAVVEKQYGELPHVQCLAPQLNQVFLNLLVNAAHAVTKNGRIIIRTEHVGEEVRISIADNGCGIPPENLRRIFDPFFTTKKIGKGTGLGLSLAYGIVKKHHGRIEVESEVGKGATFTIVLPVKHPWELDSEHSDADAA